LKEENIRRYRKIKGETWKEEKIQMTREGRRTRKRRELGEKENGHRNREMKGGGREDFDKRVEEKDLKDLKEGWREEMEAGEGEGEWKGLCKEGEKGKREKRWKQEKGTENGRNYERRARREGEKRWKQEKGTENGRIYERRA
jgi:hypothetical protein